LDVLRQAQKVKPDASALLVQEMNSLLRANRAEDAIKAFQEFSARRSPGSPMPDEARSQALHAMLMTGDLAGAANLTTQAARDTGDPRWRRAAVLIALSQKPESAKALLPEVGAAGPYEASLGLLVAAQTGQPVAPWKNRLDQLQKILLQANPPQSLSLTPMLLAAIATGAKADAEAAVASMKGAGPVVRAESESAGGGRRTAQSISCLGTRDAAAGASVGHADPQGAAHLPVGGINHTADSARCGRVAAGAPDAPTGRLPPRPDDAGKAGP
jgi:hypothetical protein